MNIQSDKVRAIQTLRLEPVKGAKKFGIIAGLLDSGADDPVMSEEVARVLCWTVRATMVRAYNASGHELLIIGETEVYFSCPCKKCKH